MIDKQTLHIRVEVESDFRSVEELTREAFWNVYVPGCNEHFRAKGKVERIPFVNTTKNKRDEKMDLDWSDCRGGDLFLCVV